MERFRTEALVIGAGVVGLAAARRLAQSGVETLLVERNGAIGMETSARNSEVIHAGLYYPRGSIKARSCRAGRDRLYAYCAARGIAFRRCGKLVFASHAGQTGKLEAIWRAAAENDVTGLVWLSGAEARALEPALSVERAFLSPDTGIIDSHGYMLALQGDFENAGGALALNSPVAAIAPVAGGFRTRIGGAAPVEIESRLLVNAAGHGAPTLAAATTGLCGPARPQQWYAKGNYFALSGRQPFSRLVYPVPEAAGLGIHATIDLQGRCRFGPDVEWVTRADDLAVDPGRAQVFYDAIRTYWPDLADGALQPDYAGIRPKLHGPDQPMPDFRIDGPEIHGLAGLVNLFGIESPGLTASLALADMVVLRLGLAVREDAL